MFLFLIQSWEFGIPLCRELACQYESLYDYQSLSWIRVSFAPAPPQPRLSWPRVLRERSLQAQPLALVLLGVQEEQRPGFGLRAPCHLAGEPTCTWSVIVTLVLRDEQHTPVERLPGGGSPTSRRSSS